jgi:ribosome-interacting GTPase 1
MPANATPEYAQAQRKYLEARTREEKLVALEEMLRTAPKHKGAANLLKELKRRLAKLKAQEEGGKKGARRITSLPKEGDVQICMIGLTQSGKSTMLSKLTNTKPEISNRPYTTNRPEMGVAEWTGVKIQLVEIPSTFHPQHMAVCRNADGILWVYDSTKDMARQWSELDDIRHKFKLDKPGVDVEGKKDVNPGEIFSRLWSKLGLIRIYTKEPGGKIQTKALVLKEGATVKTAARVLHQDFVKFFRYARVWGSARFPGEKVGLDYKLKDKDVLEIHAG